MHAYARMTKQNGHHSGADIEHGYQDWRDQRERERGRDDFRGLDRDPRMGPPRHNTSEHGDRYQGGGQWSQGNRDQYAERDRDMSGDSDRGYGYDDGDRERMSYRGQSGAQAGGHYDNEHMNYQGGNRGHWGDFDRGGQSGGARDRNYDTQSPRFGRENEPDRMRGPHAGKGPQGFQRSDERIKELIHEALTDHAAIDATHVTVDVKNGEVVLTGTVDDRSAKRLAEDLVQRVNGVKDVQNQLRISMSANHS
jgi:osmotically-inducible protein OsmY